jgi:hypothetical protein
LVGTSPPRPAVAAGNNSLAIIVINYLELNEMKKGHDTVVFWLVFAVVWFSYESRSSAIINSKADLLDRQYQAQATLSIGQTLCADGWVSNSYGGGGTCSSHGGIKASNRALSNLAEIDAEKITSSRLNTLRLWSALFLLLAYFASPFIQSLFEQNKETGKAITPPNPVRKNTPPPAIQQLNATSCPVCQGAMVKRIAKKGKHKGHNFWGCGSYPRCKGTRPAD